MSRIRLLRHSRETEGRKTGVWPSTDGTVHVSTHSEGINVRAARGKSDRDPLQGQGEGLGDEEIVEP